MGLFGRKAAKKSDSGGYYKRADGSMVQMSAEEFGANPELQLEVFIVSLMDDVDQGLGFLSDPPYSREELHAAVTRLATIAMRTGDLDLTTTLWRVCTECTRLDDMPVNEVGEFLFDTVAWIFDYRTRFTSSGDAASEAALSMVGTTATKILETRRDHADVMRAVQAAAGRAR